MTPDELQTWVARLRAGPLAPVDQGASVADGAELVRKLLPHRAPMLLLDSIGAMDSSSRTLRAARQVCASDPIFKGHFPERPIYPGVLLIEMIGQAGLYLLADPSDEPRQLIRVHHALFLRPVSPDERLDVHATVVEEELTAIVAGQVYVGEHLAAIAIVEVY